MFENGARRTFGPKEVAGIGEWKQNCVTTKLMLCFCTVTGVHEVSEGEMDGICSTQWTMSKARVVLSWKT